MACPTLSFVALGEDHDPNEDKLDFFADVISRKYEREVQATLAPNPRATTTQQTGMTLSAEEEAELAALMSDED